MCAGRGLRKAANCTFCSFACRIGVPFRLIQVNGISHCSSRSSNDLTIRMHKLHRIPDQRRVSMVSMA